MESTISFFLGTVLGSLVMMFVIGFSFVSYYKAKQDTELPSSLIKMNISIRVTGEMYVKIKDFQRRGIDWQSHAQTGALRAIQALIESKESSNGD